MIKVQRSPYNPLIAPSQNNWESVGTFNGSVVHDGTQFHMLYRALSSPQDYLGITMNLSTIGHALSSNGIHFGNREQFIKPEFAWEKYGCEDPRITKLDDKYYILYTALSSYPFTPQSIKIGVATTFDFTQIVEKHPVTTFNSKAMALFPERIGGKIAAILTVHTDMPPAKICLAKFDDETRLWSEEYWNEWYLSLSDHAIPLQRTPNDQVEVGAPPVLTKYGWLLIYSYIKNYLSSPRTFGIEAALLDLENPQLILARTDVPLFIPEKDYELFGNVPNIVFPSGAYLDKNNLSIYYGASDTTCCLATCEINDLLAELLFNYHSSSTNIPEDVKTVRMDRFEGNPIIEPEANHPWESKLTFNPAAVYDSGKVHIIYRAMGDEGVSVFGYAASNDGKHISERSDQPIYIPRESFEKKSQPGDSGCEDPRITKIDDRFYMCYTAYDGSHPPRVALTSISSRNFHNKNWRWKKPVLISPPGQDDKNTCILPETVRGKYVILHRFNPCIWIDYVDNLNFDGKKFIKGNILLHPRSDKWDSEKIGIGGPPVKTKAGWLLIYHGLSKSDRKYRLGVALLNLKYPERVISRLDYPILEPEAEYEYRGLRPGTVFACGVVSIIDTLYVYYGGADQNTCAASINLTSLILELQK